MNWNGCDLGLIQAKVGYCPGICLNLSQNTLSRDWDFNPVPLEYDAQVLNHA